MGRETTICRPPLFTNKECNPKPKKMKIYRKTYGVKNLMEWQATIPVGKGRLIIHFAGGTRTAYGVTPATYKTEDPIRQAIIEKSDYFHSGRIFLVKSDFIKEVPDPVPAASAQKPATVDTPAPHPESTVSESGNQAKNDDNTPNVPSAQSDVIPSSEDAGIAQGEHNDSDADNGQKEISIDENGFATVEVTCTEDARRYLIDNFGFTPSAVRTKEFIRNKAAANKIKFTVNGAEL